MIQKVLISVKVSPATPAKRVAYFNGTAGDKLNLFVYNSETGLYTQLTESASYKGHVEMDGDHIVWADARDDTGSSYKKETQIYLYDLSENTETKITEDHGRYPHVYGNYLVYRNGVADTGDVVLHTIE